MSTLRKSHVSWLRADLAVGAAGSSAWERCCLGLPTIMVVLADNQRGVARALGEAGAAVVVDNGSDRQQRMAAGLGQLLADSGQRAAMSARAASVTDGYGADRVVAAVRSCSSAGFDCLRPCTPSGIS